MQAGETGGKVRSERPRCPRHGLVLGPTGQCIVCRREQATSHPQPIALPDAGDRAGSLAGRVVTGLLALGTVAALAAGYLLLQSRSAQSASQMFAVSQAPARGLRDPHAREPVPTRTDRSADPTRKDALQPSPAAGDPFAQGPNADPSAAAEPPPPPNPVAPADDARAADERRHVEVMAAIAARERARATGSLAITMYSTTWCGACKAARAYMEKQGISFTDLDVEADAAAKAQQLQLNPRGGVPTIDVDGRETLVGFSAKHLDEAIARSVAARTGS